MSLDDATRAALVNCMAVKRNESVLIITDKNKLKIANSFFKQAKKLCRKIVFVEIPVGKRSGEEPPKKAAELMKQFDVIMIATTKSLTHTKARRDASKRGARIASMPGITEDMAKRTFTADYRRVAALSNKITRVLEKGKTLTVRTKKGTDITMSMSGMKMLGDKGLYHKKGKYGNLPSGETAFAPVEGSTNGVFVVDASMHLGKVDKPVKITVKNGFAVKIEGGKTAAELRRILKKVGKKAYNIAELGIGTNDKARISGNVLEDEKVLGTAHIALGNNKSFGGTVDVPLHIDGVFKKPTIFVDDRKIMEEGRLVV